MDEIKNEAEAAEQMIDQIKSNQEKKAAKHAKKVEDAVQAIEHSKEVAANIAAGEVATAKESEPVAVDPSFDPESEAVAGARMIDDLLERRAAHKAQREERIEAFEEEVAEETASAHKVTDSMKEALTNLKEKLTR